MNLLGIDVGTTGVRALVIASDGAVLASATAKTTLERPGPDLVVTDFEDISKKVTAVTQEVVNQTGDDGQISALSFSLQGEAFVPVDSSLNALAKGPVSMDARGVGSLSSVADKFGTEKFQAVTGQPLHPMFPLLKLGADSTLREISGVDKFLCLGEFLAGRIGAEPILDTTMAARTGGFNVEKSTWESSLWDIAGVGVESLPEVVSPGTVIGEISSEFAAATGLTPRTAVVVGSHDQAASFWGGGGRAGRESIFAFGSSDCLTVGSTERPADLLGTGFASYRGPDELWLTLAGTAAGGWALEWLGELVAGFASDPVAEIFRDLGTSPSNLLVLPYLSGSGTLDNDPRARGAIAGLTLTTSRNELVRAFVESAGYELAKIIDALEARGVPVGSVRGVGTGAWNPQALQLRSNAAGRALLPVNEYASARGAAIQAGVGIGVFENFSDTPEPKIGSISHPEASSFSQYQNLREQYRSLFVSTQKIGHMLAESDGK